MFPILRFLAASQELRKQLLSSPLWSMLQSEPVIMEWINALEEVEKEAERIKQNAPQAQALPENQSER